MRRTLVVFIVVGSLGTAGLAIADPDLTLTTTPHRHYVTTNGKLTQVGPRYCDNPNLLDAFTQFHANTHSHNGVTGEIGPLAPGLHDGRGGEITSGPC
jgi:hypothetical protein